MITLPIKLQLEKIRTQEVLNVNNIKIKTLSINKICNRKAKEDRERQQLNKNNNNNQVKAKLWLSNITDSKFLEVIV